MDNRTKYEHPDFFLFLNLYFFFGDCETRVCLNKLHRKTGSSRELRKFRFDIKQLTKVNDLPDYEIFLDTSTDKVIFKNRNQNTPQAEASRKREKGKKEVHKLKKQLFQNK